MPAININGAGSGLQAAIEALTAAINRTSGSNGGPAGGGGGGGGGSGGGGGATPRSSIFGTRAQRADARWLDADYNARRQFQRTSSNYHRAEANQINQQFDLRKRFRERRLRDERTEANWDNQDFDLRRRQREKELREQRTEANWDNQDFDLRRRQREKELREQRGEANWYDQDYNKRQAAQKKLADQAYRIMRAEADYMNRKFDSAQAGAASFTRGEADHFNRQYERNASAQYRFMRADADAMNRQFDRDNRPPGSNRPGSNSGYGSNPRNSLQALAGLMSGRATMAEAALVFGEDVVKSPFTVASWANTAMSLSKPYNDLRQGTAAMGMGGNFNGYDLQDILYPGGQGSGNGPGGQPAPAWMKQYGLTPESAMGILGKFGIMGSSGAQSQRIIQSIAGANYMPYLGGLGFDQYAKSGALATTLGITDGSQTVANNSPFGTAPNVDRMTGYFQQLQKVTAVAVSLGLDKSQSIGNVENLLKMQASTNSATLGNGQGMMDFWTRMDLSGLASMRTGQGQLSMLGQMNNAVGGIGMGGNALQSVAVQRFMSKNIKGGLPRSADDIKKIIGEQTYNDAMRNGNPVGQREIANVLAASKTGSSAFVMDALIPLLQNNPGAWENIMRGSGMMVGGNQYLNDRSLGRLVGTDYAGGIGLQVTQGAPSLTALNMPNSLGLDESLKDVPPALRPMLLKASQATGVPVELLASIAKQESTFQQVGPDGKTLKSSTGALGLMQLEPGTAHDMGVNPNDPGQNIMGGARYFAQLLNRTGGDYAKALALYHEGPGHFQDVMKGDFGGPKTRAYVPAVMNGWSRRNPNMTSQINAAIANTGQANVQAGEYASNNLMPLVGGQVGDDMLRFTGAVNDASTALRQFIDALMHGVNVGHGARSPGLLDLPQIFGGPNPIDPNWRLRAALPSDEPRRP